MIVDFPTRLVETPGLSSRVATRHIYAPFGSSNPTHLAYATGDRVAEQDIPTLEALGYDLPEWGNDPPDVLERKLKEVASMDVAETKAYEAFPERYGHLTEDAPSTEEVVEDSKEKMETGEIADTRISGVGTDPDFKRDDAGAPPDPADIPAREAGMNEGADGLITSADAKGASDENNDDEDDGAKAVSEPEGDKAVKKSATKSTTKRKPASK